MTAVPCGVGHVQLLYGPTVPDASVSATIIRWLATCADLDFRLSVSSVQAIYMTVERAADWELSSR
jgi:hypothetical protein